MRRLTPFIIIFLLQFSALPSANCAENITIQLRWLHQFQFAGYYAAIEKGYYVDAGFDVTLLEGGVGIDTVKQVLNGTAQYGVTNTELLLHRAQGDEVVVLAAIFQHSPHVFLTRSETGITHPQDFIGKRVKMSRDIRDIELHAMLRNEGVSLEQLIITEKQATPADYLDPTIDVIAAYITDQSFYLKEAGIPFTVISPSTYGIDFYGDSLFTTQSEIDSHPAKIEAFRKASLAGWQYAMAHPGEIADILISQYGSKKSREHLLSEAEEMQKLILPNMIELGHMNPGRWNHIGQTFIENGTLEPGYSLKGFIYDPSPRVDTSKFYKIGAILLFTVISIGSVTLALLVLNSRLKNEVVEHKNTAIALRKSQKKLVSYANQTEQFSLSAASILSIEDENVLFAKISKAIVEFSDFDRVLISLFHTSAPFRELIGHAGVSQEDITKVKKTDLPQSWYSSVFDQGFFLGQSSYYIPHTLKHILNQEATIFGTGEIPADSKSWHPEDNLFVRMSDEHGKFIGVISVDNSKSGDKPTDDIVRPLEIYASLISQIIISKRSQQQRELLEDQLSQAQKMEAIGNLAGGIAHDFNNILGVILGHAEMALRIHPKNETYTSHIDEINLAGLRAKDIVQHLLTFSRKKEKELSSIKINDTIQDSIKFLRSTLPSTINISSEMMLDGYTVFADPTQIYQIILNLCTNAAHAMEEYGGELMISGTVENIATFKNICSKELSPGEYVKISIKDTGHGIADNIIHRIFDPYFTTKDIGKGTGMGLAIVHGIVESHKGAIKATSQPKQGCTFDVYLPVCNEKFQINEKLEPEFQQGTERILLVDDDKSLLEIFRRQLQRLGYVVEAYDNSMNALTHFRMEPENFSLLITDMTMPQLTGDQLSLQILKIRPGTPIFLCTGYSDQIDEERAKEIGIRRYFQKPVSFNEISLALREELDTQESVQ